MIIITGKVVEHDGILGFFNKKDEFVELTNWSLTIIGTVRENECMVGVVVVHPPKNGNKK